MHIDSNDQLDDQASRQAVLATLASSDTWHDGEAARVLRQRVEIEGQLEGEADAIVRLRIARGRREGATPNPGLLMDASSASQEL